MGYSSVGQDRVGVSEPLPFKACHSEKSEGSAKAVNDRLWLMQNPKHVRERDVA